MDYKLIIGLEVHCQLLTNTKLFCGCPNKFNPDAPNTQTCPVCLGLPGALPVMNELAFRQSVEAALALNCQIAEFTKWDRKQYFYPDLPKAYQISQYDLPFSHDGHLEFRVDPEDPAMTRVGIIRVHLEEDAGKNIHDESGRGQDSLVDLNRAGTPLMEIVSEPEIYSAKAARRYLEEMRLLLTYIGVSDCNMQEGSLRCDANINLHVAQDDGSTVATPIVEIKNMNSFRGVEAALEYEEKRQWKEWQETGRRMGEFPKTTRGWDADRGVTFGQRSKEEASDYRYFPDPDLVPITVTQEEIAATRDAMCELPANRRSRLTDELGLSAYDAGVVIDQGRAFAEYFETVSQTCGDAKQAANWTTQDVLRELNDRSTVIEEFSLTAETLGTLLKQVVDGGVTIKSAREVFASILERLDNDNAVGASDIETIIDELGLRVVSDTGAIEGVIAEIVAANEKIAEDFRSGKQGAIGPLIGQVMRQIKGADPKTVRGLLIEHINRG